MRLSGGDDPRQLRKLEVSSFEQQLWGGIVGIVLIAVALVALAVGVGVATFSSYDPSEQAPRFGQCYNAYGPNCVLTGDTLYLSGDKVQIAGLDVPGIATAKCPEEKDRGIDAALRLADLLNRGNVTQSAPFRDPYGRTVRKVFVNGDDVAIGMIASEFGRPFDGSEQGWCS